MWGCGKTVSAWNSLLLADMQILKSFERLKLEGEAGNEKSLS